MRILLCLLLFLSSVSAQTTDIDLTVLQEFKIVQDQKLQAFKNQQRNELAQVEQRQILTLLLEQVEHQKALVLQLVGSTAQQVSIAVSQYQQQYVDDLWRVSVNNAQVVQVQTDSNDLNILNSARNRKGLPSYKHDEELTEVASERANRMARQGRMKHLSGSFSPGRAEGISRTSSKTKNSISNACYAMSRRFKTAGAKCVISSNGKKYCSLILR